jgi:hypothetical protein
MDPGQIALSIPVVAIIMGGLVKISSNMKAPRPAPGNPELDSRVESLEQEMTAVRQELAEAQERLDFTERLLAQSREAGQLKPPS